jgi:hypothetical protein
MCACWASGLGSSGGADGGIGVLLLLSESLLLVYGDEMGFVFSSTLVTPLLVASSQPRTCCWELSWVGVCGGWRAACWLHEFWEMRRFAMVLAGSSRSIRLLFDWARLLATDGLEVG